MKLTISYETAKMIKGQLESKVAYYENQLSVFPRNEIGLTPDSAKTTEWYNAREGFQTAFDDLRNFNGRYVKTFKKELAEERRNRFKTVVG